MCDEDLLFIGSVFLKLFLYACVREGNRDILEI